MAIGSLSSASATSQKVGQLNSQIADLSVKKDLVKVQKMRDLRDLRREGARFMGRQSQFIARSGAAGTASDLAMRMSSAGEFARSAVRIGQDADAKIEVINAKRSNLKSSRTMSIVQGVAGVFGGALSGAAGAPGSAAATPGPTPSVTRPTALVSTPEQGVRGRALIGTSQPGGIGGF